MDKKETSLAKLNAAFFDEEGPEGQSNPEIAKQEIDFIIRNTELPEGSSVLDIPCGEGHHSQVLAENYKLKVTGVDGGSKLIDRAKESYFQPKFFNAYFEDLAGENLVTDESQEAVMCINNSFGYLSTVKENEDFLLNMYKKVKAGGVLVVHTDFNPYRLQKEKIPNGEIRQYGDFSEFDDNNGDYVESFLPSEYVLKAEDESYRNLQITNSAIIKGDGSHGPRKKYANYLTVKHDNNPNLDNRKPVDIPVLRSLAQHMGVDDQYIKFHMEPYEDGGRTFYRCMMSIKKPVVDNFQVEQVQDSVRDALGNN